MKRHALTLVEVMISMAVLSLLVLGILSFQVVTFTTFTDQQVSRSVHERARVAMEQIVKDLRNAISTEVVNSSSETSLLQTIYDNDDLATLPDAIGDTNARAIFMREVLGGSSGGPVFGPGITIVGPHLGVFGAEDRLPCEGIVRLRHPALDPALPDATFVQLTSAGPDDIFGTFDDNTGLTQLGEPELMLLVPSVYAPRTGPMLRIDQSADPFDGGRILRITIRLNWRSRASGDFQLAQDVVLQERIALRQ